MKSNLIDRNELSWQTNVCPILATHLQPDIGECARVSSSCLRCEEVRRRMEERRRSPRHQVGGEFANLPANMSVRVIDISSAGVLLQSARMLNPGSRGSLRFTLAGAPFAADIQVQRVSAASEAGSGYRIGATFVGMTLEHRRLIERFMNND